MSLGLGSKDNNCYVCGSGNPMGLRVPFTRYGEHGSQARYTVQQGHVGWPGLLHGGLLFALMDEALGWALYFNGLRGVTAKTEVRFRAPVPVGATVWVTGLIVKRARNLVRVHAEAHRDDEDGEMVAELDATMYLMNEAERA